jgi:signal transduction histidine kinase
MIDLVLLLGVAVLLIWAARRIVFQRRQRFIDLSDPEALYPAWIAQAAAAETAEALHVHIIKHAHELTAEIEGNGTYETWSASMHNLLAIYDLFHGVAPDTELKLERMTAKFMQDPVHHLPPPAPVPERIVSAARGPSIERRRRMARELHDY